MRGKVARRLRAEAKAATEFASADYKRLITKGLKRIHGDRNPTRAQQNKLKKGYRQVEPWQVR